MNAFVEGGVEDAGHLAVAHIVAAFVSVRGHQRAVCCHVLAIEQHLDFVVTAFAVDAQRAVAGVVKNHGIALLRQIHEILLHGGDNAIARGLVSRQDHDSRPRLGRRRVGKQNYLAGREAEFGAGKQVGHGLGIIHRAVKIIEFHQPAAAISAIGGMLGHRARG